MKKILEILLLLAISLTGISYAEKPSSGEVDCEKPIGDSAKRTCEECGYIYDGSGRIKQRPDFDKIGEKDTTKTASEK